MRDLTVRVGEKRVLKRVSVRIDYGKIHAIMGPNGSGKSSLAYTIMGREGYEVEEGDILLDGESILGLETHERALKGIFLGMQDPPAIPGVRLSSMIIAATNKRLGERDLMRARDPTIVKRMRLVAQGIGLGVELLQREINVGFSGGEKKRSEVLQASVLSPKVVIFDEPDSGLDVDGVRSVAEHIRSFKEQGKAVMLITHYARLLQQVKPDEVTVLLNGEVVARGGPELALMIEEKGYGIFRR